ncbi:hypothetical protein [Nitrosopumilus sp.]|uniref:hypothetical protein n=1 Tax=Nitrosopumilus sp. TaxID=2024843 RepID=UPI00349FD8C2
MKKLPEKFPEYLIMYKTLSEQIKKIKKNIERYETNEIETKVKKYKLEMNKIKEMFPESFLDEFD